jgi:tRNA modification GTPase
LPDTIVAISTPIGTGAISVIRMSGSKSWQICQNVLLRKTKIEPRKAFHNYVKDSDGTILDEVMVIFYKSPNSYTGEDMIEIMCHGGIAVTQSILDTLISHGARPAEPGEFTRRAFLNGKIDLTKAEAVKQIIEASSRKTVKLVAANLAGRLSEIVHKLRETLLGTLAKIEVEFDYPDEILTDPYLIEKELNDAILQIEEILKNAQNRLILSSGIKVVIIGKPNVGKSTLLNTLVKEERAIVTDIPGTTRDLIEVPLMINGISFTLIDTAGIRHSHDEVEKIGVERAIKAADEGNLILFVLDATTPVDENDKKILSLIKEKRYIVVINKIDATDLIDREELKKILGTNTHVLTISALKKEGIQRLEEEIIKSVKDLIQQTDGYITTQRQYEYLASCRKELSDSIEAFKKKLPLDIVAQKVKEALGSIDKLLGTDYTDDLLDRIFKDFCVGK